MKNPQNNQLTSIDIFSFAYLLTPLILFLLGWTHYYISIPLTGVFIISIIKLIKGRNKINDLQSCKFSELCPALIVLFIYLFFTGMTGNWQQHPDYYVRNDIFWDLTHKEWPPQLDDNKLFIYYFQNWLPASFIGSFTNWAIAQWTYYIWSCLGITLSLFYICKSVGNFSFLIVCLFFCWNGLELIPCSLIAPLLRDIPIEQAFSLNDHVAHPFLTEAACYSLKNISHVFIPISLICGMLLQNSISKLLTPALACLAVMYSPMSALFLLPLLLYIFFGNHITPIIESTNISNVHWKNMLSYIFSIHNIPILIAFFLIIIPFYSSTEPFDNNDTIPITFKYCLLYLFYILFNIGIVTILIWKQNKNKFLWWVFSIHLICIASGLIFHHDIAMKGSVVTTYFIAILFCRSFLASDSKHKWLFIVYSIFGICSFYHMTGALASVILGILCYLLIKIKIKYAILLILITIFSLFTIYTYNYKLLAPTISKLKGEQTRYHKKIGIYQQDGGSGLWWWYRGFPNKDSMPFWFK